MADPHGAGLFCLVVSRGTGFPPISLCRLLDAPSCILIGISTGFAGSTGCGTGSKLGTDNMNKELVLSESRTAASRSRRWVQIAGVVLLLSATLAVGATQSVLSLSFEKDDAVAASALENMAEDVRPVVRADGVRGYYLQVDKGRKFTIPSVVMDNSGNICIEFWFKSAGLKRDTLMRQGDGFKFHIWTRGRIFYMQKGIHEGLPENICDDEWHHVAVVRRGEDKSISIILDGVPELQKQYQVSFQSDVRSSSPLEIGAPVNGGFSIDALKIWTWPAGSESPIFDHARLSGEESLTQANSQENDRFRTILNRMEKHDFTIIPCPKYLDIAEEQLDLSRAAVLTRGKDASDIVRTGADYVREALIAKGIMISEEAGSNAVQIIVGAKGDTVFEGFSKPVAPPDRPQGYTIVCGKTGEADAIAICGNDELGALYGCMAFYQMIKTLPAKSLPAVSVRDYPDFFRRGCWNTYHQGMRRRVVKNITMARFNNTGLSYMRDHFRFSPQVMQTLKETNDYLKKHGIMGQIRGWTSVGAAPRPESGAKYYYPVSDDVIGHRGMAFTWSDDAALAARAEALADFARRTGTKGYYLHFQDTYNSNWDRRPKNARERFGDDYAAALANVINHYFNAIREVHPDAAVVFLTQPYWGYDAGKYPAIQKMYRRLATLVPSEVLLCVREGTYEEIADWNEYTRPLKSMIYHQQGTCGVLGLDFPASAPFVKSFYHDPEDLYWAMTGGPVKTLVYGEYAWNTEFPGAEMMLKEPLWWQVDRLDKVSPDLKAVLKRACRVVYGQELGHQIADAIVCNVPLNLAVSGNGYNGSQSQMDYFKGKQADARRAWEIMCHIEQRYMQAVRASEYGGVHVMRRFSNALLGRVFMAARLRYLESLYAAALGDGMKAIRLYSEAAKIVDEGREEFARYSKKYAKEYPHLAMSAYDSRAKKFLAGLQEPDATWALEKKTFLSRIEIKPIRVGVYRFGYATKSMSNTLLPINGLDVKFFEKFTEDSLNAFDLLIFNATKTVDDTGVDWREELRAFVERGGRILFTHNACGGRIQNIDFDRSVFPEILGGVGGRVLTKSEEKRQVVLNKAAMAEFDTYELAAKVRHSYDDQLTLKPADGGEVLAVNADGDPLLVVGEFGKGKVAFMGTLPGLNASDSEVEITGGEFKLLLWILTRGLGIR